MITLESYQDVLAEFARKKIMSLPIETLHDRSPDGGLFIKHDIEAKIAIAVKVAEIEHDLGHRATYYFQGDFLNTDEGRKAIKRIAEFGHEVAYHYDVLDENNGDYGRALSQFQDFLKRFEEIGCSIQTVCPHGNPTKVRQGWKSNKDFFRSSMVRETFQGILDIVIDFPKVFTDGIYISDAGYKLRVIGEIANNDHSNEAAMKDGTEIQWEDLSGIVEQSEGVVLSIHPHRITESGFSLALQKGVFKVIKNIYIIIRHIPGVSSFASKFYKFSRWI